MQFLIIFIAISIINLANAESIGQSTGFKIPRFVSTKFDESNLRVGASKDYPIHLTYTTKNLPLEIIEEHEKWRKVSDIDGNQGWMDKRLLKGDRYGIIKTSHNQPAQIYNKPEGIVIGNIGNRNIIKIHKCFRNWCYIGIKKNRGWINKLNLWGIYSKEEFNIPFYQLIINLYWKIK